MSMEKIKSTDSRVDSQKKINAAIERTNVATPQTFGVLRAASSADEKNCNITDASITPSNLYNIAGYRKANTTYSVDDVVGCPYHHSLQLKCIVAGTTSNSPLDTSLALKNGDTIEDASVTWTVEKISGSITYEELGDINFNIPNVLNIQNATYTVIED